MFVTINNLKIHYHKQGAGPLVFFLHGWGANLDLFRPIMDVVSIKYTAVALDFPGFGQSDEPPVAWGMSDYVQFFVDFVHFIVRDEPGVSDITLVGHSFGGRVIIRLMGSDSTSTAKMDCHATLAMTSIADPSALTSVRTLVKQIILVDSAGIKPKQGLSTKLKVGAYKAGKAVLKSAPVKSLAPDAYENFTAGKGSADYQAASSVMRATLVKVVNEDLTPFLPQITVPSLLMWGRDDTATPLADGKLMEQLIPAAGLAIIDNAGHYSFLDQPPQFTAIIKSFLQL